MAYKPLDAAEQQSGPGLTAPALVNEGTTCFASALDGRASTSAAGRLVPSQCARPPRDRSQNESKRQLDSWPGGKGGLAAALKALRPSAGVRAGRADRRAAARSA
jgi:hypothetical protein